MLARSGQVLVIATMRSSAYDALAREPILIALKDTGATLDVAVPGPEVLAETVRRPAEVAGLTFDRRGETRLDEALLATAGGNSDALPLLGFTLQWLFEHRDGDRLTFAAYDQLGGLEGAIGRAAEQAFERIDQDSQAKLPRLLRGLAEASRQGSGLALRDMPLKEASEGTPQRRLVDALIAVRILLVHGEGEAATLRFAHEAVLRGWERARDITTRELEFYRIRQDVSVAERRWRSQHQRHDLLLVPGLPLAEAQSLQATYGAEISPDIAAFVSASSRRAQQRQRRGYALAGVFGLVAIAAIGASLFAWRQQQIAEKQRNDALNTQSQFLARDARAAIAQGNATLGGLLALAALPANLSAPDRPFVKEAALALEAAMADQRERLIIPNTGTVNALAVAPNGTPILATAKGNPDRNGWSRTVRIIELSTGKELNTLSHSRGVYDLSFSPDGTRLISRTAEPDSKRGWHVQVWQVSTGGEIFRLDDLENVPQFSSDGRRILLTGDAAPNELRDAQTGTLIKSWPQKMFWTRFSPDGKSVLALAYGKGAQQLWSAETGDVIRLFEPIRDHVSPTLQAFSPDGSLVVIGVGAFSGEAQIFETRTGSELGSFRATQGWSSLTLSSDNRYAVAVNYSSRTVELLNTRTGAVIASIKHEEDITSAAFLADGSRLSGVSEGRVSLWDSANGAEIVSLRSQRQNDDAAFLRGKTVARFSPTGDRLLLSFNSASTQLLDTLTGAQVARLIGVARSISEHVQVTNFGYVKSIGDSAFSPDKRLVVTVDEIEPPTSESGKWPPAINIPRWRCNNSFVFPGRK